MVTVVDPNGTPVPVYNRSGVTVETVAANGTTQMSGTQIVANAGWVIVIVTMTNSPDNRAVKLPDSADIGTMVELYANGNEGSNVRVFPASGDSLVNANEADVVTVTRNISGCFFRKVSATEWRHIAGVS